MAALTLGDNTAVAQQGSNGDLRLEYRLEAAGSSTAKSAKVKFTLTNRAEISLRISLLNTPLGGSIGTRMFAILCDNDANPLRYQGPLKSSAASPEIIRVQSKMEEPGLKDTAFLNPGDSRSATVDLAGSYNLPESGTCKITFTSLINVLEFDALPGGGTKYTFVRPKGDPLVLQLSAPG